jgi:hypothetical protein
MEKREEPTGVLDPMERTPRKVEVPVGEETVRTEVEAWLRMERNEVVALVVVELSMERLVMVEEAKFTIIPPFKVKRPFPVTVFNMERLETVKAEVEA